MNRGFKKLIGKITYGFKYILNILNRLLKVLFQSAVVCFPVVFVLLLINATLGVHIRFSYYFKFAILATIGFGIILSIFKWRNIIAKPPVRVSRRNASVRTRGKSNRGRKVQRDRKTQRAIHRKRTKIS